MRQGPRQRKGLRELAHTRAGERLMEEESLEAICAGTKERHDATQPAKLILQLSRRARKEGCRKACWMQTCRKGGSARYADQVA